MDIILASGSKARKNMLASVGLRFETLPAEINEEELQKKMAADNKTPEEIAMNLAKEKSLSISKKLQKSLVIGGDQVLVHDKKIMTKSTNKDEAKEKLLSLRGKTHALISAVCVSQNGEMLWEHSDQAQLKMKNFDDDFLQEYLDKAGDALTRSVGCYEIEGFGALLFEKVQGDQNTIMGMPLLPLLAYLKSEGALS